MTEGKPACCAPLWLSRLSGLRFSVNSDAEVDGICFDQLLSASNIQALCWNQWFNIVPISTGKVRWFARFLARGIGCDCEKHRARSLLGQWPLILDKSRCVESPGLWHVMPR